MEINLYQIIGVVVSFPLLFLGVYRFVSRKKGQTLLKLFANLVIWGGILLVSIFPGITDALGDILGVKGAANGIIFLAFLVLFFLIFRLLSALEKVEENLTTVVRRLALKNLKKKK